MRLFKIYEKMWLVAIVAALGICVFNFTKIGTIDHTVYFPFFVAVFCAMVYYTKRNHRRFVENFSKEKPKDPS